MSHSDKSPSHQIYKLITGRPLRAYPAFAGKKQPMYQYLISSFNAVSKLSPVADLRTDVYPNPIEYPLSWLYTIISEIPAPSGGDLNEWEDVQNQILTEITYLNQLYTFQQNFINYTEAANTALSSGFTTAQGNLDAANAAKPPSGSIYIYDVINGILAVGALNPQFTAVCVVLGVVANVLETLPEQGAASGSLESIQEALGTTMTQAIGEANSLYTPIAADWGKLERFNELLPSLSGDFSVTPPDLTAISNQYETSVYQALVPSTFAWIRLSNKAGTEEYYLAYQPVAVTYTFGTLPKNATVLTDRINALGISWETVLGWGGGWVFGSWCNPCYTDKLGITTCGLLPPGSGQ